MRWESYSTSTAAHFGYNLAEIMRSAKTSSPTGMMVSWSVVVEKTTTILRVSLSPHPDEPLVMDELKYSEPDPDLVELAFPPPEKG